MMPSPTAASQRIADPVSAHPDRVPGIALITWGGNVGAEAPSWLREAVSAFGEACRLKLTGPGDREAAIRSPLESLLRAAGDHIGVPAVFHDEVRDAERRVAACLDPRGRRAGRR